MNKKFDWVSLLQGETGIQAGQTKAQGRWYRQKQMTDGQQSPVEEGRNSKIKKAAAMAVRLWAVAARSGSPAAYQKESN